MSFRICKDNTVIVSSNPSPLPQGQDSQILTNVNGSNIFSYPGYEFQGDNIFPQNVVYDLSGIVPQTNQAWFGAVLHPNGFIYTTPHSRKTTLVINPYTNTWTEVPIPILTNVDFYRGGVVAPNSKIYYPPWISEDILVNDVPNNRFYKINAASNKYAKYNGCVLAPNNLIYCIPADENNVMVINPENDTFTRIDISGITGELKWAGGVLAPNGNIYCAPAFATSILVINTQNNTAQYDISGMNGYPVNPVWGDDRFKYNGGALGANGRIYFVPYSFPDASSQILEVNPSTNIASRVGPVFTGSATARRYVGATLAPNGVIYSFYEVTGPNMLTIDTNTTTPTFTTNIAVNQRSRGSCLGPNNTVYAVPVSNDPSRIKAIKTGIPSIPNWMLAPNFNKF